MTFTVRYIGTFIADFHRTLTYGGIFLYPGNSSHRGGKLRLLYEAIPASFIMARAGGMGINEKCQNILDVQPIGIHDRCQVFLGSTHEIAELKKALQE